jgi:Flp pilus assembly protein TadG
MRSTSSAAEPRRHGTHGNESGATVVEFLGVAVLVMFALMTIVQFSIWVFARNVVTNAADEGARLAAESGRSLGEGEARARAVLRDGLGVGASRFEVAGAQDGDAVVVRARGAAPTIVPFLPALEVRAEARAFDEDAALPR